MKNIRVIVLRGGMGEEHNMSLRTGKMILEHLPAHAIPIDVTITKTGKWLRDRKEMNPHQALRMADLVFNALHGRFGESGEIQSILRDSKIPFTGSDTLASIMSTHKLMARDRLREIGIQTPRSVLAYKPGKSDQGPHTMKGIVGQNTEEVARSIVRDFALPVILKPVKGNNSVDVFLTRDVKTLNETINTLFEEYDSVLVEEYIDGKEATCGVIDKFRNQELYTMIPIQIILPKTKEVFDAECKRGHNAQYVCPGNFSVEESKKIQECAKEAHKLLNMKDYSRSDFIISPRRGIFLLEVNALPDLSKHSLFLEGLKPIGCDCSEFVEHLIGLALSSKKGIIF